MMRRMLVRILSGAGLCLALTVAVPAVERQHPVVATWIMDSYVNTAADEAPVYKFGKSPVGQLILTPDGHFAMTFMGAPPAEEAAPWDNYLFAFGTYRIDSVKGQFVFHFLGSNNRKLIGTDSVRFFRLQGDQLTVFYEDASTGRVSKAVRQFHRAGRVD